VTKDPDTGRRNLGIRRCQVKGPDRTGILFGAPDRGGAIHHAKWKMRGQSMPAGVLRGRRSGALPRRAITLRRG